MFDKAKRYIKLIENYIREDVHNPLSTMSNLTYIGTGLLAMYVNFWLGLFVVLLGIASTGFHWIRNDCWNKLDIIAIFYVFGSISSYLFFGYSGLLLGVILSGIGQYFYLKETVGSRIIIGILGVLTIIPFWVLNGWEESLFMLLWFVLAGVVSFIGSYFDPDQDGIWYDSFHGIWHIFSGIGIYYLILGTTSTVF